MKQQPASSTSGITTTLRPIRVLLVDDHADILALYKEGLSLVGFEVQTANDGQEALELLLSARVLPEIVVTDIEMPRLDGLGLVRRINQDFPKLKVLFVTGASEHPLTNGHRFLVKPFPIRCMIEQIIELCQNPAP